MPDQAAEAAPLFLHQRGLGSYGPAGVPSQWGWALPASYMVRDPLDSRGGILTHAHLSTGPRSVLGGWEAKGYAAGANGGGGPPPPPPSAPVVLWPVLAAPPGPPGGGTSMIGSVPGGTSTFFCLRRIAKTAAADDTAATATAPPTMAHTQPGVPAHQGGTRMLSLGVDWRGHTCIT